MQVSIDLSPAQAEGLRLEAERLVVTPETPPRSVGNSSTLPRRAPESLRLPVSSTTW